MTKFIAVSNRRGGVGKTTLTMILAYGLSVARRQKVLLVDLDAQASTSIIMMGQPILVPVSSNCGIKSMCGLKPKRFCWDV